MKIQSSPQFEKECVDKLGIRKAAAMDAVLFADRRETLKQDECEIHFFVRKLPSTPTGSGLLVYCQADPKTPDVLTMMRAFRVYPDLCEDAYAKRPLELLEAIVHRFGVDVQVGDAKEKFIFNKTVAHNAPLGGDTQLWSVPSGFKRGLSLEMLLKVPRANETSFPVTMAYCIDEDSYIEWMRSHGR